MVLTDHVRISCRSVMDRASFVRIDGESLCRLAREFPRERFVVPPVPTQFDEHRAMRVLAADAINFGSGYHDVVRKLPGLSGARTMYTHLNRYIDATGPLTHRRLTALTPTDCSQIFGQELDGGALEELITRFASAFNDLGSFVYERGGTAESVLETIGTSAVGLVESLTAMPFYIDRESYYGCPVSFYKRAQITAADLHRRHLWHFDDLDQLTAFADNLVPHVLRIEGALIIDDHLAARIGRGDRLTPGSPEEVELRAAAVVGVEELVSRIGDSRVWAMHVDEWLWERGGEPRYKAHRRHRSRSVFY